MPVVSLDLLDHGERFRSSLDRVLELPPGVVITAGQHSSGKVTALLALALRTQRHEQKVVIFTDQPDYYLQPFYPLPPRWSVVAVEPNEAAWDAALAQAKPDDLLVVAMLNRENARAVMGAASAPRWIFVAVDTALAGLDLSYVLRDLHITYADFAENVRLIVSMLLLPALCEQCSTEVQLPPAKAELLVPGGNIGPVRLETGCDACGHRGTDGRIALSDITMIAAAQRDAIKHALVQGLEVEIEREFHLQAQDEARDYLAHGIIGLNTFREAIQRNPLLRAQHALQMAQVQAEKLAASLWLDLDVLTALADRTATGLLVVDESGKVKFANALARKAVTAQGEFAIVDEHVRAKSLRVTRLLADALRQAVQTSPRATRIVVPMARPGQADIFVTPLPTSRGFARELRRLALLLVGPPGQAGTMPSEPDLRSLFDLSPAESKVAMALCAGRVPKEVARELGLSVATVRTHVRALLAKTGTSRQTQLMQLLASVPRIDIEHGGDVG
jgi:DNA-binding CsgD family transcriptional regulator